MSPKEQSEQFFEEERIVFDTPSTETFKAIHVKARYKKELKIPEEVKRNRFRSRIQYKIILNNMTYDYPESLTFTYGSMLLPGIHSFQSMSNKANPTDLKTAIRQNRKLFNTGLYSIELDEGTYKVYDIVTKRTYRFIRFHPLRDKIES